MLGVEATSRVQSDTPVAAFIEENRKKWLEALHPSHGVVQVLHVISEKATFGSLLQGVCNTISSDLMQCRNAFLREGLTQDEALKVYQRMCALLREAQCVIAAQAKGIAALPSKKALMLLKLQNLHTKYDQFSKETHKANVSELQDLSEKLGRFGIHDPSIFTKRLFTQEELSDVSIDTLKDTLDILVDTMKKGMSLEEWQTNTASERGAPFIALEQELVTDFDLLVRAEIRRTV